MININKIIPSSLLHRLILIIVIPTLSAHLLTSYIFYKRHITNVNNKVIDLMTENIVNLVWSVKFGHKDKDSIIKQINENSKFEILIKDQFSYSKDSEQYPSQLFSLKQNIENKLSLPVQISSPKNDNKMIIEVDLKEFIIEIYAPSKMIYIFTTHIFIIWLAGSGLLFASLSVIFVNNQIAPLKRLSKAVDGFGKNRNNNIVKIEGAKEVRKTAIAFIKMKSRIEKHISQLKEMLAGVSHDLRTPITRMRIELEMLKKSHEIDGLKEDLIEMENMINSYLDFAKGEDNEPIIRVNIYDYILNIINSYNLEKDKICLVNKKNDNIKIDIKSNSFRRAIHNILNNALRYGTKIIIKIILQSQYMIIFVEDNGCGIEENLRKEAFKPFSKLDLARNLNNSGMAGLGLTIAKNIINNHGGDINLADSEELGGLKVIIKIPI